MNDLPGLGSGPLDIVVRTAVIYVAVVIGLRLGGKREVGQLGTVDLVALLLIANAVQNAMVGTDSSLAGGLISAAVILSATRLLDMALRRSPTLRRLLVGQSRILIANGHVNHKAMNHEQVSDDDLQEALHEHGLEYRREVKRATLEVDGSISIIPQPEAADRYQAGGGPDTASRRAGRIPRHSSRHPLPRSPLEGPMTVLDQPTDLAALAKDGGDLRADSPVPEAGSALADADVETVPEAVPGGGGPSDPGLPAGASATKPDKEIAP